MTSSAKVALSVKGWLDSPLVKEAWVVVRDLSSTKAFARAVGFSYSRMVWAYLETTKKIRVLYGKKSSFGSG